MPRRQRPPQPDPMTIQPAWLVDLIARISAQLKAFSAPPVVPSDPTPAPTPMADPTPTPAPPIAPVVMRIERNFGIPFSEKEFD